MIDLEGKTLSEINDIMIRHLVSIFKTKGSSGPILVNTTDIDNFEKKLSDWCNEYGLNIIRIDCRTLFSNTEFCNQMRTLSEGNLILFSHVTEIPLSSEQKYIGWAIQSTKDETFFDIFPSNKALVVMTTLPKELCDNYCLAPIYPPYYLNFDYTNNETV